MFVAWTADLILRGPGLRSGRLFMSVSPHVGEETHPTVEDDTSFLDGWLQPLVRAFLVVPPDLSSVSDPERFRERLIQALLDAEDVEVFSIWNPSFLLVILRHIERDADRWLSSLSAPRRAALKATPPRWTEVWPELRLISCWRDAHAAGLALELETLFPGVTVQGKGLLATEGPMTVPVIGAPAPVPLVDRVLFELLDDDGVLHPLHRASPDTTYELIVSIPGGLPRYRLGDRVHTTGLWHHTPCLRFVGRRGGVCDLVGEKLHSEFVEAALMEVVPAATFKTLVPLMAPARYVLLLASTDPREEDLAQRLDDALKKGHHYRLARDLGQLARPEVWTDARWPEWYLHAMARGTRLGDVKPRSLVLAPANDWALDEVSGRGRHT
jgi:hypothetical protein